MCVIADWARRTKRVPTRRRLVRARARVFRRSGHAGTCRARRPSVRIKCSAEVGPQLDAVAMIAGRGIAEDRCLSLPSVARQSQVAREAVNSVVHRLSTHPNGFNLLACHQPVVGMVTRDTGGGGGMQGPHAWLQANRARLTCVSSLAQQAEQDFRAASSV